MSHAHALPLVAIAAAIALTACSGASGDVTTPSTVGGASTTVGGASASSIGGQNRGGATTAGGVPAGAGGSTLVVSGGTSSVGSGGANTGGATSANGGNMSGGAATGGAATGGAAVNGGTTATGGKATGGSNTGGDGQATGGKSTGGAANGGAATGGAATGGMAAGGVATGGTAAGGATMGGAAIGGAAIGGGGCTAVPVTPNATQQTKNVLCYLHSIYGNGILSGQEEDNNDNGMNTVFAATGKYPAIRAFDVNNSQAPTQCVTHWNNGGICMFGYHMGINGGNYNTATNINNVLTAGTAENTSFNADLDRVAQFVTPLKNAGGVAILRLFHEAGNNCAWFWWGMGSSAQWQSLFKYAFNYLTATKGLNNVLWMAPLCQRPTAAYNPGPQYIDMGGADNYVTAGDTQPMTSMFQAAQSAFPNMMVALHECGTIPDPNLLKSTGTKWLLFNVWASPFFTPTHNTTAHLQEVYSNPYVITRDKLPSFK